MELHTLGIILLVVMAVDALSVDLEAAEHIVVDNTFIVVFQTTLTDGECLVADVRRRYETEAEPRVDAVGRDGNGERTVVCPAVVAAGEHIDLNVLAFGSSRQLTPFVDVGLHLVGTDNLIVAELVACHHPVGLLVKLEGQRCDVHRNGDVDIVGVDFRPLVLLVIFCRQLRAAGGEERYAKE